MHICLGTDILLKIRIKIFSPANPERCLNDNGKRRVCGNIGNIVHSAIDKSLNCSSFQKGSCFLSLSIQNLAVISRYWGDASTLLPFRKQTLKQSWGMRFLFPNGRFVNMPLGVFTGWILSQLRTTYSESPQNYSSLQVCLFCLVTIHLLSVISDECNIWFYQKWVFAGRKTRRRFWCISAGVDLLPELSQPIDSNRRSVISVHLSLQGMSFPVVWDFS